MAVGSVLGAGEAGGLQQGMVGAAKRVSRRRTSGGEDGGGLRSGGKIPRSGQCAVRAIFPGADFAVSVSSRAVQRGGNYRTAAPVLDLREQEGRRKVEPDAFDGAKQAMAGSV